MGRSMIHHSDRAGATASVNIVRFSAVLPYLLLLGWVGVPLLLRSTQQSLMAHDEGVYAIQARFIANTGDWVISDFSYDRTIGIQCLIALCFSLFGVHEGSARLPSLIASASAVLLTYNIGCLLLNRRLAFLGSAVLSVTPLWILYGRLATQDATLVLVELLGIWAVLKAERQVDRQPYWAILAGATVGLGFLIKGFMIIPAVVALLPYLIWNDRRQRHLLNPWLYLGILLGFMPVTAWLVASSQRFGAMPVQNLFGKFFHLSGQTYLGAGPFYYVWNIPANAFPWAFFAMLGIALLLRHSTYSALARTNQAMWLLVGYPLLLLLALNLFGTRTHYYPLQLLPFMGLAAGVALDWLVGLWQAPVKKWQWLPAVLSYTFGAIGLLMLVAGTAVWLRVGQGMPLSDLNTDEVRRLGLSASIAGLAWVALPLLWRQRHHVDRQSLTARRWLACWLLGPWLALAMLGLTGIWGNYAPELKSFLAQPEVATVLQSHTVDFVMPTTQMTSQSRKTQLLLRVYTPSVGFILLQPSSLRPPTYAWIGPGVVLAPSLQRSPIASFQGWQLMQLFKTSAESVRQSSPEARPLSLPDPT